MCEKTVQELLEHQSKLVAVLKNLCYAVNTRGRLDEGGHDYNTEEGSAYRAAWAVLDPSSVKPPLPDEDEGIFGPYP